MQGDFFLTNLTKASILWIVKIGTFESIAFGWALVLAGGIRASTDISVPAQTRKGWAENRESGANPERYRHCKRGGRVQDESQPLDHGSEKERPNR